jgi:hypothetical protein
MTVVPRGIILDSFPYATFMIISISSDYFPRQHYLIGLDDEEEYVSSHSVTLREREDIGNRKRKR